MVQGVALGAVIAMIAASFDAVNAAQPVWARCGGIGWSGDTTCVAGSHCLKYSKWYSQCVPNPRTTTSSTKSTTTTTTAKPTTSTTKSTTTTKPSTTTTSSSTTTTQSSTTTTTKSWTTTTTSTTTTTTTATPTGAYKLSDSFVGPSWLTGFDHIAIADPTNGRVNYTDKSFALAQNLTFVSKDTIVMRADSWTTLSASGPGRNSVRIQSKKTYTTSVVILDTRHMPEGCATWPAFWTTGTDNWPVNGEIDIIEGVNDVSPNTSTLHTTANCTMSASTMTQTGKLVTTDCDWEVNYNSGCGIQVDKTLSYGPAFNAAGGGWYAMERTATRVNVWFWSRNDATVPVEVKNGSGAVSPATWGTPYANFVNDSCDFGTHLGPENIIINLTLCGDYAGNPYVYPSTCPQTCVDHVNNDPASFANAYWDIASLRVYE
ncbi:hypothetical protein FRB90_008569 [Tulasnella sp. 427]|nr:hypothetical protein FRB90_008569 [Tulasnella sp. 427]